MEGNLEGERKTEKRKGKGENGRKGEEQEREGLDFPLGGREKEGVGLPPYKFSAGAHVRILCA